MSYHHRLDIRPVPEEVIYINEPWIIDDTISEPVEEEYDPEKNMDKSNDNVRVYLPLDINADAVLRRLSSIIGRYEEANEDNEMSFEIDVCRLLSQVEIYDQIHYVRGAMTGKHSVEACALMRDFVDRLKSIPDGCSETFPFELIERLEAEYGLQS